MERRRNNIDYAVSKSLKVILILSLRAPATTLFTPEDCVVDSEGMVDKRGVWSAPVTERRLGDAAAVHVKLSALLGLNGWEIKQRYFDPALRTRQHQVHVVIDNDFIDPMMPIIPPMDY